MRIIPALSKSSATWWWVFGLLIAAPALALAILGLWAARAERIEREQQLRRQQTQVVQLIDGAVTTVLTGLETELRRVAVERPASALGAEPDLPDIPVFSYDQQGLLTFLRDRVYFGDFGVRPTALTALSDWPPSVQRLIEQAHAAEAQQRSQEAVTLYRRIMQTEPRLSDWVELGIARARHESGAATTLTRSSARNTGYAEGLTPTGLPVAFLASADVERLPEPERTLFLPLVEQILEDLRNGRWWLSQAERRFYDAALRRLIENIDASRQHGEDARLETLAKIEQVARQSLPYRRDQITRAFVQGEQGAHLIIWAPSSQNPDAWMGMVVSQERLRALLDAALAPLLSDQPFDTEIRDAHGATVWGGLLSETRIFQTIGSRTVREWEYAFSESVRTRGERSGRLLWYGFIALLVVMLLTGVAMTARVVRREMELSRLQNEFVAAVSHEFKSPITGVRLLMERITSGRALSPEQTKTYYTTIDQELNRLERLVNRLLVSQQIQTGRKRYSFEPASIVEIARAAIGLLRPQAETKAIRLELYAEDDMPDVPVDRTAIADVLENLLDNAIKYSPPETCVTLTTRCADGQVHIDVCDQGIGIEPDERARIFDKFYRGRRGDQHDVRGTGLGLALVKAIVEAHNGTIEVTSTPGEGSCFSLRLPVANPDPDHGADSDR